MRSLAALLLLGSTAAFAGVDPFADDAGTMVELGDLELEDWLELPISSVSLQEEKVSQAPASVFVLSGDDLRNAGFRTLGEALRTVPGLFVVPDTAYFNIGVRGLSMPGDQQSRFMVMVDSVPVNDSVGIGQSFIDRELPVGLQAVERIEVIQGPIGGIYGPVAFTGAVNVVTRKSIKPSADVLAGAEVNSVGLSGGELSGAFSGRLFGKVDVLANIGGWGTRGGTTTYPEWSLFSDRPSPADATVHLGASHAENALLKLGWEGLTFTLGYAQKRHGLDSAPYGAVIGNPGTYYSNQNVLMNLAWEHRIGIVGVMLRGSFQEALYHDELPFSDGAQLRNYRDDSFDRWASAEARVTVTPIPELRLVAGGLGQYHLTDQLYGYTDEDRTQTPVRYGSVNLYALLEGRLLHERLLLQGGVNYSYHSLFSGTLVPRAAAVYRVTDTLTAKLSVSGGFRHPTFFEAFYDDGVAFVPNKELTGDSALSTELTIEAQPRRWARVGVTGFDTHYARLIAEKSVLDPLADGVPGPGAMDVLSSYVNLPPFDVYGAQAFFDLRQNRARVWGGVSVQDFHSDSFSRLPGFAHLTANLTVSTSYPYEPVTLSASGVLISPRWKDTVVPGAEAYVPWGGSLQLSARWAVPWVRGLALQLVVQNIFGQTLRHPVQGDYAPITEAQEPELLGRFNVEWRY